MKSKRILHILLALMALIIPLKGAAGIMPGDANDDGTIGMDDLTVLINYLLSEEASSINFTNAATCDGLDSDIITMDDLTILINYLLTNEGLPTAATGEEEFVVNGVPFVMVTVEGGTFMMGATEEQGSDVSSREKPVHQVTVSTYCIGQTEVTQELWTAVMGSNPSNFTGQQQPVERVSWHDCHQFITQLNQLTGRDFRLPTEAEWEFAARGGNESQGYKYSGSNNLALVAWYSYNDTWERRGTGDGWHGTHPVATRMPNELNLFDMSGNVHEWTEDWYGNYTSDAQTNPTGPATGTTCVYRGGSWYFDEWFCRVSFRNSVEPTYRSHGIGLRLAL